MLDTFYNRIGPASPTAVIIALSFMLVLGFLLTRLTRLGEKWHIPVAYSDDFGHGENSAVLPIGVRAVLDTEECTLEYDW